MYCKVFLFFRFGDQKCRFRDIAIRAILRKTYELCYCVISETALPITKTKTLSNTKYPLKPGKTHLKNHFWPLRSGFSAIATYKTCISSKSPDGPILKFFVVTGEALALLELLLKLLVLFIFRHASVFSTYPCKLVSWLVSK